MAKRNNFSPICQDGGRTLLQDFNEIDRYVIDSKDLFSYWQTFRNYITGITEGKIGNNHELTLNSGTILIVLYWL